MTVNSFHITAAPPTKTLPVAVLPVT